MPTNDNIRNSEDRTRSRRWGRGLAIALVPLALLLGAVGVAQAQSGSDGDVEVLDEQGSMAAFDGAAAEQHAGQDVDGQLPDNFGEQDEIVDRIVERTKARAGRFASGIDETAIRDKLYTYNAEELRAIEKRVEDLVEAGPDRPSYPRFDGSLDSLVYVLSLNEDDIRTRISDGSVLTKISDSLESSVDRMITLIFDGLLDFAEEHGQEFTDRAIDELRERVSERPHAGWHPDGGHFYDRGDT